VAKQFLKLADKHFLRHHRYHKLFNRNNVKCSYSCMNNMAGIISSQNGRILVLAPNCTVRTCHCIQQQNCPLHGKCLTECVVYKTTVSATSKPVRHYYGLTEGSFKTDVPDSKLQKDTAPSKCIWELRDQDVEFTVELDIAQHAAPYKCGTRQCDMCLTEKMVIATADPTTMLNSHAEIISTCIHRAKFRLDKVLPAPTSSCARWIWILCVRGLGLFTSLSHALSHPATLPLFGDCPPAALL
jgi:hypothetical protein